MRDRVLTQAEGLLALNSERRARMLAMVQHGDTAAELPLLWQVCSALADFGYRVSVLDASVSEALDNPGLQQLLENDARARVPWSGELLNWAVLPCAQGLHTLGRAHHGRDQLVQTLASHYGAESVVILYAPAPWLARLLGGSDTEPLLVVSNTRNSLISGYTALKRLLVEGSLQATVVNLVQARAHSITRLGECAKNFLGYDLKPIAIEIPPDATHAAPQVQRLVTRLLESAVALPASPPGTRSAERRFTSPPAAMWSH